MPRVVPGSLTEAYKRREGDFAPDLVGYQFTNSSSIFTFGNFVTTTNLQAPLSILPISKDFSEPFTLENLGFLETQTIFNTPESNALKVKLNFNKNDLSKYAYFGSLEKFLETEIQNLILKWKGSLYLNPQFTLNTNIVNTVLSYSEDPVNKTSKFLIPTSTGLENNFNLVFDSNSSLNLTDDGDISNLTFFYGSYQISNEFGDFKILDLSGSSTNFPYITVITEGFAWPNLSASTFGAFFYHLRPNDFVLDEFFRSLTDFQSELLNRRTSPKYKATLEIPSITTLGSRVLRRLSFIWPVTDGYNIDINGSEYANYLSNLLQTAKDYDLKNSNIIVRRLISDSIVEFDTQGDSTDVRGRKVDKLLKIWGREYDEVKKYIDGISFANVVTYDKKDNTADEIIKMMAQNLGFDAIQTFSSNNLLEYITTVNKSMFDAHSSGFSIKEVDTELWRRLVINAWWLFKSKGTRKVLEFFLELFNIDECMIDLNEIVYVVEKKLDYEKDFVEKINEYFSTSASNLEIYPIDEEGYPKTLPNTNQYYFQNDGFWYNGGITKLEGNNPHFGPYDFGNKYFNKFRCFIDGFEVVETTEELNELTINFFKDYGYGTIESSGTNVIMDSNGLIVEDDVTTDLIQYGATYATTMNNTNRISGGTIVLAGKDSTESNSGLSSFRIKFNTGKEGCPTCPTKINLDTSNLLFGKVTIPSKSGIIEELIDEYCCSEFGYFMELDPTINVRKEVCWWCPPTLNLNFTTKEITLPNGKSPLRNCCEARSYSYDSQKNKCFLPTASVGIGYELTE